MKIGNCCVQDGSRGTDVTMLYINLMCLLIIFSGKTKMNCRQRIDVQNNKKKHTQKMDAFLLAQQFYMLYFVSIIIAVDHFMNILMYGFY